MSKIKRGEIYYADLGRGFGSEQGGIRPVLIIQNDMGNQHSPTTIIAAMTSRVITKKDLPVHIVLHREDVEGLKNDSIVLCEQIRTIDKRRIKNRIGCVNTDTINSVMGDIKTACDISLGF